MNKLKRIVLFGDSHSSSKEYLPWYTNSFPILLEKDFQVIQNAEPAQSNENLVNNIIKYLPFFNNGDCIVLQTTYLHRGTFLGKAITNHEEMFKYYSNFPNKMEMMVSYLDYIEKAAAPANYQYFINFSNLFNAIKLLYTDIKIGVLLLSDIGDLTIPGYDNNIIKINNFNTISDFRNSNLDLYFPKEDRQNHFTDLGNEIIYNNILNYFNKN